MRKVNKKEVALSILTVLGVFGVLTYGVLNYDYNINNDLIATSDNEYNDSISNEIAQIEQQEVTEIGESKPEVKIIENQSTIAKTNVAETEKDKCNWTNVPNYGTEERTNWYKSCDYALDDSTPEFKIIENNPTAIANDAKNTKEVYKISETN